MGRQYSAKTFLRSVPNFLLKQYFEQQAIDLGLNWLMVTADNVEWVFAAMEKLPENRRCRIDSDFRLINELACERGTLAILDQAGGLRANLAERFERMKNAYERAFWTFLNEPDCFRTASCFHEMDRMGGWRRRFLGCRIEAGHDREGLQAFEKALQLIYRRQGRGRFCHVDYYLRQNPERHCYFAYPEDYANTDIGYDEHGQFQQRARRSALEIIFVYRPDDGMLELRGKGNGKQIAELQRIFGELILGLDELPDEHERVPYDLDVLKDACFPFSTDPQDRIAAVHVRQLRLRLPGPLKRQITLSAESSRQAPQALHDLLHEAINRTRVPLSQLRVAQAKLRLTFTPEDGERPRTLTFEVAYPDRCTLKDDPHDQVAKKYLQQWGIACA
jgi:hypothetical protein